MAGPWEKYQSAEQEGPWTKYGQADTAKVESKSDVGFLDTAGRMLRLASLPSAIGSVLSNEQSRKDSIDGAGGGIRGAGSIGSTLIYLGDKALEKIKGGGKTITDLASGAQVNNAATRDDERRKSMDAGLRELGIDTNSPLFKQGKLGAEIAGTSGVGGLLAKGAKVVGAAEPFVNALASSGMTTGAAPAPFISAANGLNLLTRAVGGAVTGGASAGLVNPDDALAGAKFGGALPVAVTLAGKAGGAITSGLKSSANKLMQSAIKPTIQQLKSGDAATATKTLLDYGISPNAEGVNKLKMLIGDINDDISTRIANSNALIKKSDVLPALDDVKSKFIKQVSPTSDLNAINSVADDFLSHPLIPGDSIPIQAAQDLKQGTYKILAKKYGQIGNAETEAQKGIARGLKDQIANAIPEISGLNAEESRLITTLNVAERRALMELNKNPVGLAALASDPGAALAFLADRSAGFKSLAARMINATSNKAQSANALLESAASNPLLRYGGPVIVGRE